MYDEALGICTKYFAWYPHTRCQMWDAIKKEAISGDLLVGYNKVKRLTLEEIKFIHEYALLPK
jgi:hypothetical protein